MSSNVEKLLILQDRDRKIQRLSRDVDDLPAREKLIKSQLARHQKTLEEAEDAIRKKSLEQKDLEAQIEKRKERIQKFRQQQMEVKSNADYRAFEHQIATVNGEIRAIEEKDLVLMEEIEALTAVREEKKAALNEEEAGVNEELDRLKQRTGNMEKELAELQKERQKLSQEIDPDWLSRYERVFQHVGDYALVTVEHQTCGGCHMKLPPQMAHDARKLDSMSTCMYCGRLLYFIP